MKKIGKKIGVGEVFKFLQDGMYDGVKYKSCYIKLGYLWMNRPVVYVRNMSASQIMRMADQGEIALAVENEEKKNITQEGYFCSNCKYEMFVSQECNICDRLNVDPTIERPSKWEPSNA